jgi:hypothetical protein
MIAFYYGITGFACPIFYRRELFKSAKSAILVGLAPLLGGLILAWVFIKSCIDLANPENSESGDSWFGLGPPLVIGVGFLLFGVLLMFLQQRASPEFFRRRPEVVGPDGKAISAPTVAPTSREGSPMAGEVIVGYDGSPCAKGALSQAVEQAPAFGRAGDRLRLRAAGHGRRAPGPHDRRRHPRRAAHHGRRARLDRLQPPAPLPGTGPGGAGPRGLSGATPRIRGDILRPGQASG